MKKGDFVAIFAVILLAAAIFALGLTNGSDSLTAVVRQDGKIVKEIALAPQMELISVEIGGNYTNILHFEAESAWFDGATCPNQTCVAFGKLRRGGQSAICTENGVILTLEGANELDAVVK